MSQLQSDAGKGSPLPWLAPPPARAGEARQVRVLDVDEDLARWLEGDRLTHARRHLTGGLIALATGSWDVTSLHGEAKLSTGLLVIDGFIARELAMDARVSIELLGPGDLLRPWDENGSLLAIDPTWNVLSPVRAVVLGAAFSLQVREFPEVSVALLSRVHERALRLAESQAIAHTTPVELRVHAMFWHLADRWGRVTPEGVVVPLALSHRMLAELVGARRPSVSAALGELARRDVVSRRTDGSWLLRGTAPGRKTPPENRVRLRRRFVQSESS